MLTDFTNFLNDYSGVIVWFGAAIIFIGFLKMLFIIIIGFKNWFKKF